MPTASTSLWNEGETNTLVGGVCNGGVNPIGGDGWDDTVTYIDEIRPRAVCHCVKYLRTEEYRIVTIRWSFSHEKTTNITK